MSEFYIVSLKWTAKHQRYITFWRPENNGYSWPLAWSGRYSLDTVMASLGYYNNGYHSIAVPCEVVDQLTTNPVRGDIDGDAGPVVLNVKENWKPILAAVIAPPEEAPWPEVYGRKRKTKSLKLEASAA